MLHGCRYHSQHYILDPWNYLTKNLSKWMHIFCIHTCISINVWLHTDRAKNKMMKIISQHCGIWYGKTKTWKNHWRCIHKVFQEKDSGFADNALIFMMKKTFKSHLWNVGPTSSTLDQHCINVIQMFCDYWELYSQEGSSKYVRVYLRYMHVFLKVTVE